MAKRNLKSSGNTSRSEKGIVTASWKAFWTISALSLWVLMVMNPWSIRFSCFFLVGAYLLWRFRTWKPVWIYALLFSVLMGSEMIQSPRFPEEGVYRIVELKERYAIARKGRDRVVVYDVEQMDLDDEVKIGGFEEIHSLNNPGLFSFERYMTDQNIRYTGKVEEILEEKGWSLKRWIWKAIDQHPGAPWYRMMAYGWSENEALQGAMMTGLPLIAMLSGLRSLLSRFVNARVCEWILLALQVGMMVCFPIRTAVIRLFVFSLMKQVFRPWESRWAASMIVFLVICPGQALSMSLLMPAGLSLVSRFVPSAYRKAGQIFWCALVQIACTGKLDFLLLIGFLWLRNRVGMVFWVSLIGLPFPNFSIPFVSFFEHLQIREDLFCVYGSPPFWFLALMIGVVIRLCLDGKRKSLLVALVVFCLYPFSWRLDPFFHLYQIDVGQGDAALIVEPFGRSAVMIDAAGRFNHDNASELFIPFLRSRQIGHLDALIISHADFDHSGSAESLMAQFPVEVLITQSDQQVPVDYAFELLLPERIAPKDDENDQSLICRFGYDGHDYLWTGDASQRIEMQLVETYALKSDVIKLGHHGSDTSSCREFLRKTDPVLALISSGKDNRYGHPRLSVLQRLDELGIDRLNTADHGCLHLFSFHHLMVMSTADGLMGQVLRQ